MREHAFCSQGVSGFLREMIVAKAAASEMLKRSQAGSV
jgi:hypothetical protein